MERLAQYSIRNPFSVEKMRVSEPGPTSASGSILYRSGMNAITGGIPFKAFKLDLNDVKYAGWMLHKCPPRGFLLQHLP